MEQMPEHLNGTRCLYIDKLLLVKTLCDLFWWIFVSKFFSGFVCSSESERRKCKWMKLWVSSVWRLSAIIELFQVRATWSHSRRKLNASLHLQIGNPKSTPKFQKIEHAKLANDRFTSQISLWWWLIKKKYYSGEWANNACCVSCRWI